MIAHKQAHLLCHATRLAFCTGRCCMVTFDFGDATRLARSILVNWRTLSQVCHEPGLAISTQHIGGVVGASVVGNRWSDISAQHNYCHCECVCAYPNMTPQMEVFRTPSSGESLSLAGVQHGVFGTLADRTLNRHPCGAQR
jgi:hypothetical protein